MTVSGAHDRRSLAGECATLAALGLAVVSGALPWASRDPAFDVAGTGGALFVSGRLAPVSGFALRIGAVPVGWLVVCAAVLSALGLLVPAGGYPTARRLQIAAGAMVAGLAALHAGPYGGVVAALACGVALIVGAQYRYGTGETNT